MSPGKPGRHIRIMLSLVAANLVSDQLVLKNASILFEVYRRAKHFKIQLMFDF